MDFLSMSSHKIFGLKGIGLLLKKDGIVVDNLIHGGKSTTNYRSGTPALPLICSLMKALELILPNINNNYNHVKELNKVILDNLNKYENIHINSTENSIPYIINFSLKNIKPETFIHALDEQDIYISTKSACSTKEPMSNAVYAVTKDRGKAKSSIRITLSYLTTEEEIDKFLDIFALSYQKLNIKG